MSYMTLTHHPVRLFRLSCGCLRSFPMMPAGVQHTVLCITCRRPVRTVAAYPERCCAAASWATVRGTRTRISCTRGVKACVTGLHLDEYAAAVPVAFTVTGLLKLARSREGKTGRA